jgi:formylglycine-generating enzyme required for sulfatase activity
LAEDATKFEPQVVRWEQIMWRMVITAAMVIGLAAIGLFAERSNRDRDMALIAGATYQMGIDQAELPRYQKIFGINDARLFEPEMPKHLVTIESFYIDRKLVTNAQFKKFVDENLEWRADRISSSRHNGKYLEHWKGNEIPQGRADHPVVNVSWYSAVAYCQSEGKRLPTEAEWEYAAKGKLNGIFPWGDAPADKTRANFSDSGTGSTSTVGSYPANGYGLFDMAGNVWEYLADEWGPYGFGALRNPITGGDYFVSGDSFLWVKTRRVIRGGSWGGAPINLWVEYRDSHPPENARDFVGFRCAKSVAK